jgi:hypothetical protein
LIFDEFQPIPVTFDKNQERRSGKRNTGGISHATAALASMSRDGSEVTRAKVLADGV